MTTAATSVGMRVSTVDDTAALLTSLDPGAVLLPLSPVLLTSGPLAPLLLLMAVGAPATTLNTSVENMISPPNRASPMYLSNAHVILPDEVN